MKYQKFIGIFCFIFACEGPIESENDSTWMDLVDPQEMEEDEADCLHCSELRRPEDFYKACKSAKQLANLIAQCQCNTCESCPEECGYLDYLTPECAQGIDYYACENFWNLCDQDK
jgi:hypothetical protein